ncbi:MAG: redoxin domain-containing protein [Fuerstiella sp.]|nr:redoxin domain-containing protein [Fuerstiella sp.]
MLRNYSLLSFCLVVFLSQGEGIARADQPNRLIGRSVGEFSIKDYRGKTHSLSDYASDDVVVLAFLGTECPLAKLYSPRLQAMNDELSSKGVAFLAINSNRQDSLTEVAAHARVHGVQFPVLKDLGNRVADQIGVMRTPEIVVLDRERVGRYHGRIDDQYGVGYIRDEPQKHFLKDAINDLLDGRKVAVAETEVVGCYIGRVREPQADSDVTYSNQISRILQKHCVECHRKGEIAPFALTKYDDVIGWGDTMVEVIADQRMPPWHANPKHGSFANARLMTDSDKQLIRDWVDAGCPEGDPGQLPEPLKYTDGWQLPKKPDKVINMRDHAFDVSAEGTVRYQYFEIDPGLTEDTWIQAAEAQPGNRAVVHHILVFVRPPNGPDRGMAGTTGQFLAAYVPGHRAAVYPDGSAKLISAGSKLIFQMHYTPIGTPQKDLSRLGLVFADPTSIRKVVTTQQARVSRRGLVIPPHADNHRVEAQSSTAPTTVEVLSFMPHMHLRGKSFSYEARFPDGRRKTLLDVPQYDFNWQTAYQLTEPLSLPKGAYLQCVAHFDNSENNLSNPDPTRTVPWGDQSWDEMMIGYFDVSVPTSVFGIEPGKTTGKGNVNIGGQRYDIATLLKAIRDLDKNKDGKLQKSEVSEKRQRLFDRLDANNDDILTTDEARESIRKFSDRLKRD